MKSVRYVQILLAASICLVPSGCGKGTYQAQDTTAAEAQKILFSDLQSWDQAAGSAWQEENLEQILPNTKAWVDDGRDTPRRLSDLAVVGQVASVEPGRAFQPSDTTGTDIEHPFDFKQADYRTIEATIKVTRAWGESTLPDSVTVTVPISSDVNPAIATKALESLDTIVLILRNQGFYSYAPQSWRIARNNALIGIVEKNDTLKFPALLEDANYFSGIGTLGEFTQAASGPEQIIDLRSKD
ncbi:MAG: hypothetical protein ACRCYU_04755 [Nocardioides sp.]